MMKLINKKLGIFLLSILLTGCVTVNSVKKDLEEVNYNDGVNKKEALAIARMSVINSGLNGYYKTWLASIHDRGEYYVVTIPSFSINEQTCVLVIEKEQGDILAFWQADGLEELEREVAPTRTIEEWKALGRFSP